jgi:hypothetical protein
LPSASHVTDLRFDCRSLWIHTHQFITRGQYTELVTVVILTAFVPTLIAQQFFRPKVVDLEEEEALGAVGAFRIRFVGSYRIGAPRSLWADLSDRLQTRPEVPVKRPGSVVDLAVSGTMTVPIRRCGRTSCAKLSRTACGGQRQALWARQGEKGGP